MIKKMQRKNFTSNWLKNLNLNFENLFKNNLKL